MNIAMFSDNFYPELSGISDSIIDLARGLVKLGHRIHLYVPKYSETDFRMYGVPVAELDLDPAIEIHRLPSVRYPAPTNQGRMVLPTFFRSLSVRQNKIHIVHTHLFFGVGMEGLAASKFLKIPFVGTTHTPIADFLRYSPIGNRLSQRLAKAFVSWYYNHCTFVSAPSNGILAEMKANGFKQPCNVISNPIDLTTFTPARSPEERTRIRLELNLSGFIVLYTGRLAAEKHVDVIIRAIAIVKEYIPKISFVITGHGQQEQSLKRLANELHVEDSVAFLGTLSVSDLARLYKAADVFTITSTAETQSLSLMKAMATGIPVIGVNARGLSEYINKHNGLLVEPGDYRGLAATILHLLRNPYLREDLGKGGLKIVQQWSSERITNEWDTLYREICSHTISNRYRITN
jgi:1,2-diacylglycerol 3-alpha-glucosyltransferase